MSGLRQHIETFLRVSIAQLDKSSDVSETARHEVDQLRAIWPDVIPTVRPAAPSLLSACDYLGAALLQGHSGPAADIASAIAPLQKYLRWTYSYPPQQEPGHIDLSTRIAFSQITGSKGLIADDRLHIGLTLMAPYTAYPAHAHPATELYLVIAGTAIWQAGFDAPAPRLPGAIILHPDNVAHAMTTAETPLLALWTWRGDLTSPSVYLEGKSEPSTGSEPAANTRPLSVH